MTFKLLKYFNRYESICADDNGTIWHTATWGIDLDPEMIKREALLLAEDAKKQAEHEPEEIEVI